MIIIVVAVELLEHVPLGLESSDPLSGTGCGDRGGNGGETSSGERGASGVLQSGLGLRECIGDQLHSSTESHNHGAGGEVSSNGHNCGDQGDEGGSISCS